MAKVLQKYVAKLWKMLQKQNKGKFGQFYNATITASQYVYQSLLQEINSQSTTNSKSSLSMVGMLVSMETRYRLSLRVTLNKSGYFSL